VTWSEFYSEDPQFWSAMWTCHPAHYTRCVWTDTHFSVWGKVAIIMLKILDAAIHNSVARATRPDGCVHPCS